VGTFPNSATFSTSHCTPILPPTCAFFFSPPLIIFPFYRYRGPPSRWQTTRGVVPFFSRRRALSAHKRVAQRCGCLVRLFFFSFSSADRSLLSDPLPPPSRVAFATRRPRSSCRLRRVAPSPFVTFAASPHRHASPSPRRLRRATFTTSPPSCRPVVSPCRVAPSPRVPPLPCPPPHVAPSPRVAPRHASPLRHASPIRHASPSLRCVPICGGNGGELVSGWVGGNASASSSVL
jgi:hypothetical protein